MSTAAPHPPVPAIVLEPAAQALADALAAGDGPSLDTLSPPEARAVLDGTPAGVDVTSVRYEGVFHDLMMLNASAQFDNGRGSNYSGTRATVWQIAVKNRAIP